MVLVKCDRWLLPDGDFHFSLQNTQFPQSSPVPCHNVTDTLFDLHQHKTHRWFQGQQGLNLSNFHRFLIFLLSAAK